MPSASTEPPATSTRSTSSKPERSTFGFADGCRSRKRLEVFLARPISTLPERTLASSLSSLAWWFVEVILRRGVYPERAEGLLRMTLLVQEVPAHRVAARGQVALAHHDLEQMRASVRRAEHLGAGPEVGAPDAAEALVEFLRVERADLVPVAVEALGPGVERERVIAPQVLDVHDLEAGLLAAVDRLGEARDPAAGEDVLAYPELGRAHADVADEVDDAERPGLHEIGVRLDHLHH